MLRLKLTVTENLHKELFKKRKKSNRTHGIRTPESRTRDSISGHHNHYTTEEALEVVVIFGLLTYIGKIKLTKENKTNTVPNPLLTLTLTLQSTKLENERK